MVDKLREMGGKYRKALDGERYASFSVLGTESWEDYASATIAAMQLETATDLSERSEKIDVRLARIESLMVEIRDALLAQNAAKQP